ncbi:hypothetical protein BN140_3073 [Methanoculleus bourgensis MS2]|uniref:Uncharacterized protein n=2 Tax=Methanoculleus bourgensis TaxID=83986 RepID=W6Q8U9_METBM|nr:hypothetical protein BN140_3073 [Methanoculleus bourgensis MS2]CVK34516.1 protein of unknown function [Methanoculleus bourgensis]
MLQWSHVFSDMVRQSNRPGGRPNPLASMEPCLFRHGKWGKNRSASIEDSLLQWSHVFSDMVRRCTEEISMKTPDPLQWSHVFSDMVRLGHPVGCSVGSRGFNGAMSFQTW